jgi:hypothetical protein
MQIAASLGIIALGAGGGLLGLTALLRPALARHVAFRIAAWLVLGAAFGLALLSDEPATAWIPAAAAACWLLVSGGPLHHLARRSRWLLEHRRAAGLALLAACPLLAWVWASRITPPEPQAWEPPETLLITHREVSPSPYRTDAGQPIKVFAPTRLPSAEELAAVERQTRVANLICTGPPGVDCNCHGWVFTGGRFWVDSDQVDPILRDNGYRLVSQPSAGDLIVYRIGEQIVHTGVVRVADQHGVLVESKWDKRGRYVHAPEYQDYARDFAYYRSSRAGHLLRSAGAHSPPARSVSQ